MSVQSINTANAANYQASTQVDTKLALPAQKPATELPKQETKADAVIKPDLVENAVNEANEVFSRVRPDIKFVFDEEANEVLIKLIEPGTGEVINQYPSEQAVAISNAIVKIQEATIEWQSTFKSGKDDFAGLLFKQKS
jgi:flagellar protein FlaG